MKKILLILAVCLSCAACSSHKKIVNTDNAATSASERDGSSYEKAIIINEEHERAGVDAEYAWIRKQYPGSHTNGQALMNHENKSFDLIHVSTADGKNIDVYFDISKFFGKF